MKSVTVFVSSVALVFVLAGCNMTPQPETDIENSPAAGTSEESMLDEEKMDNPETEMEKKDSMMEEEKTTMEEETP